MTYLILHRKENFTGICLDSNQPKSSCGQKYNNSKIAALNLGYRNGGTEPCACTELNMSKHNCTGTLWPVLQRSTGLAVGGAAKWILPSMVNTES
ncbi:hypothetical protein CHARACLAT_009724 [Characodon lateralis]|uniref:Uncharacterized protein n=1 Tax=Characodon lateralis TaxID=208331 RepID=A0ABU7F290_9TELE|nr:hypothetical protein [Characodon lateralis]